MANRPVSVLALTASLLLMFGACDGGPTVPNASHGLQLSVHVGTPQLGIVPSVAVFSTDLLNTSAEEITVVFPTACTIRPYIDRTRGENVFPGSSGCYQIVTPVTLAPGASISRSVVIRSGATTAVTSNTVTLPPGRYVAYAESEGSIGDLGGQRVKLRARGVSFRVP